MMSRMMNGGERHPLQIMAILHAHYGKLARLDGVDARSRARRPPMRWDQAGVSRPRRHSANYQRLGGGGVKRAIGLLAAADLDLRGATDLDSEMVMEVLVASRHEPRARPALGVDLLHQAALLAGRRVLVDDALGRRRVDLLDRHAHRLGVGLVTDRADGALGAALQLALDGLVALGALALVMLRFFWLLMFATGQSSSVGSRH